MRSITIISTIHNEIGKCNSDELLAIIEKLGPEVIFLEALEDTYSKYQKNSFSTFGVFHQKLEVKAIQKYSINSKFEYVPVLDTGLSNSFEEKYNIVCENMQYRKMLNDYNSLASQKGFDFLNSEESTFMQKEMRVLDNSLIKDNDLIEKFNNDIEVYENSMLRNIYSYCKRNHFNKAVFLCGVAHRQSIINKIESLKSIEKMEINWKIYGKLGFPYKNNADK